MSAQTEEPTTATSTRPLAISTPFVQPSDCKTQWRTTTVPGSIVGGTTSMRPALISDPVATCYPSGWDDVAPGSRLNFRPGVCPKGWVYHAMAEDTSLSVSTAFCCNSGYSYSLFDGSSPALETVFPNRCGKYAADIDDDGDDHSTQSKTVMMHQAWAVTWDKSDTETLTPKLPTLTSEMRVPKWTPGQTIRDGEYDLNRSDSRDFFPHDLYWFLVVGVPILAVVAIGLCVWCGVRKCKKNSKRPNLVYVVTQ